MSARKTRPLHRPEHLNESRLMILYALAKMQAPLSVDQLTVMMADRGWMTYFDLKEFLNDFAEEDLVTREERDGMELYRITSSGLSVILPLAGTIQPAVRDALDEAISSNWPELMRQTDTVALVRQNSPNDYSVTLKLNENGQEIFKLEMFASSAHEAELLSRKFKSQGSELYARFLQDMTRDLYDGDPKEED